jgi:hypothetical protein
MKAYYLDGGYAGRNCNNKNWDRSCRWEDNPRTYIRGGTLDPANSYQLLKIFSYNYPNPLNKYIFFSCRFEVFGNNGVSGGWWEKTDAFYLNNNNNWTNTESDCLIYLRLWWGGETANDPTRQTSRFYFPGTSNYIDQPSNYNGFGPGGNCIWRFYLRAYYNDNDTGKGYSYSSLTSCTPIEITITKNMSVAMDGQRRNT